MSKAAELGDNMAGTCVRIGRSKRTVVARWIKFAISSHHAMAPVPIKAVGRNPELREIAEWETPDRNYPDSRHRK